VTDGEWVGDRLTSPEADIWRKSLKKVFSIREEAHLGLGQRLGLRKENID
jgi:hypothetical protein